MLAAVYAAVGKSPGMVCILRMGSNSCYLDGENMHVKVASFAKFMVDFKYEKYVRRFMKKGFKKFFKYRILPYKLHQETPIYF